MFCLGALPTFESHPSFKLKSEFIHLEVGKVGLPPQNFATHKSRPISLHQLCIKPIRMNSPAFSLTTHAQHQPAHILHLDLYRL